VGEDRARRAIGGIVLALLAIALVVIHLRGNPDRTSQTLATGFDALGRALVLESSDPVAASRGFDDAHDAFRSALSGTLLDPFPVLSLSLCDALRDSHPAPPASTPDPHTASHTLLLDHARALLLARQLDIAAAWLERIKPRFEDQTPVAHLRMFIEMTSAATKRASTE